MENETNNPYAPPVAPVVGMNSGFDPAEYQEAGNGKRFLNWLIDRVAMIGLIFVVAIFLAVLDGAGIHGPLAWVEGLSRIGEFLAECVVALFYYVLMEGTFGLTLGKLITGTRVVDDSGQRPSWTAIMGRTLARFVPFEAFSFFGNGGGWHDRWSGTMVVDIRNRGPRLSPALRKIYGRR